MALGRLAILLILVGLVSAQADTWILKNGDRLTGILIEEDEQVVEIRHDTLGTIAIPRSSIKENEPPTESVSFLRDATSQATGPVKLVPGRWRRQAELGYSQQSGSVSKQDLLLRGQLDGKFGPDTYRVTARLLKTTADEQVVTDRGEADFRWRHDLSKRLFSQTLTTGATDRVRAINLSVEQQAGYGYRLIDGQRHKVNLGLAAVGQYLKRQDYDDTRALLGALFQDWSYAFNSRIKFSEEASLMASDNNAFVAQGGKSTVSGTPSNGSYRYRVNSVLQGKLTNELSLNLRYEYDFDASVIDPALRGNQRVMTTIGYGW